MVVARNRDRAALNSKVGEIFLELGADRGISQRGEEVVAKKL